MDRLANPRLRPPILLLVGIAARWLTFGNPLVHVDEEFYVVTGMRMWQGALPFVDIWDRKPVGLFLLYAVPGAFGFPAGIWAYQLLALASAVATAGLIGRLAGRIGHAAGATAAGLAYILWLDLLGGQGGQTPVFYNLLTIAAALVLLSSASSPHRRALGLLVMALIGAGLQIKTSLVFEGLFFGLWLLADEWRLVRRPAWFLGYGVVLVAVALLPVVAAAGYYLAAGQWDAFVYANVVSIFQRVPDPAPLLAGNIGKLALIVSPMVALAVVALVRDRACSDHRRERRFVAWWLAVAIASVAVFRPWFDHYALPILLPGCAAAAGLLGSAAWRRRYTPALLLTAALAGQVVLVLQKRGRGDAHELAAMTQAVGRGPGCLYVYSGTTMLYAATGRCALSRYLIPAHLIRAREAGATGVDQDSEIRRILAQRPAVVVIRPPYKGERPAAHRLVMGAMARDYRLAATLPMGNEAIGIYHRRR
ncbi:MULTISPECIES: hypothetical protein [unclassified Sphingomonas]|uniref:ArnT family glycosyltransferase n=1 Tax=unclassified Sphingomonas TaxID=196159 RepID=UPI0025EEF210|nr:MULTISPECIES: hypothetical protein [unclassified Sphingomonas]